MLDFFTLKCDFKCSHKNTCRSACQISVTLQQLYRCKMIHMQIFTKEHRANTTKGPEMERSYINSAQWPTFSTAECGQKSVKAMVVPGPFCFTSREIFIIPHRQHGDARSPLIYSDPSRRRRSTISIREDKEKKMLQIQTWPVSSIPVFLCLCKSPLRVQLVNRFSDGLFTLKYARKWWRPFRLWCSLGLQWSLWTIHPTTAVFPD